MYDDPRLGDEGTFLQSIDLEAQLENHDLYDTISLFRGYQIYVEFQTCANVCNYFLDISDAIFQGSCMSFQDTQCLIRWRFQINSTSVEKNPAPLMPQKVLIVEKNQHLVSFNLGRMKPYK